MDLLLTRYEKIQMFEIRLAYLNMASSYMSSGLSAVTKDLNCQWLSENANHII